MNSMRKILVIALVLLVSETAFSQIELRASLGLNMVNLPSLRDNVIFILPGATQPSTFQSAVEFGCEAGYRVFPQQYGIETAVELNTYNGSGGYELSYTTIMPSVMYYRVATGQGYQLKIGGGVGPRFLSVSQRLEYTLPTKSATGWGMVIRADASTQISQIAFAYIAGDIRYNNIPAPKDNDGQVLQAGGTQSGEVKFSSFSAGIKLGVLFII